MKLFKLINGKLKKYNGGFIVLDNKIYTNPKEEIIRQAGYKPLITDERPEYDVENQYLVEVFEDTDNAVLIHWEAKDINFAEVEE